MSEDTKYNIKIESGADFILPFTWYDNNGLPMDLTGATVEAQLRESSSSPSSYEFICTHNGAGGRITLTLLKEVTSKISYSQGQYDVFVNLASGLRVRPLYGDAIIQDYVTKPIEGTALYIIGVDRYIDLPTIGSLSRIYLCYDTRKFYIWNGTNYISINDDEPIVSIGNVAIFDNISDVVSSAKDLEIGDVVITCGYYSIGDEGGAKYKVVAYANPEKPWQIDIGHRKYLEIIETEKVTYRMFGAKLDGVTDDGAAIKNCHDYANQIKILEANGKSYIYPCKVENHQGIIYKKNQNTIYAYTDVDLSGSTILMDDFNSAWYGFYIWGDNASNNYIFDIGDNILASMKKDNARLNFDYKMEAPPNSVIYFNEKPYSMRNNGGSFYSVERMELMVHKQDGWCASPFCDDWTSDGADLFSAEISDEDTLNVYGIKRAWFNYIPTNHGYFIGCRVIYKCSDSNKQSAVLWVRRHNCTVSDFIFEPDLSNLQNNLYKNASIYVYGCYNVTLKNITGLNNAGKRLEDTSNATSGYVIRIFGCDTINIYNCDLSGFWGAIAASQVKSFTIRDSKSNRLDVHDGVYNITIDNCVLYTHAIQVGYGRGNLTVSNCKFYFRFDPDNCYQNLYMIALQATYGRIFAGKIYIRNCEAFCYTNPDEETHNYKIIKVEFDDVSQSLLPHFEYPELNIESVRIWSDDPENTNLYYAYTVGERTAESGYAAPTLSVNELIDNTAIWLYIDRTYDFIDDEETVDMRSTLPENCFVRSIHMLSGSNGTIIRNVDYFQVIEGGTIGETVPTDKSGDTFVWGGCTLQYKQRDIIEWKSNHEYQVNDICVSAYSAFAKGYCFICSTAGTSNGYAPVHDSGTEEDIPGENLEPISWTYIKTLQDTEYIKYAPSITVQRGQYLEYNGNLVFVAIGGTLSSTPPTLYWFERTKCGTAYLEMVGIKWAPRKWVPEEGYCVNDHKLYQNTAGHPGTTSGVLLQKPSGRLIDGKIIWQIIDEEPLSYETWSARTEYEIGDIVKIGDDYYECVFNGRLALPNKFYFGDIRTNAANQYGWVFDYGTEIATIEKDGDIVTKFQDCDLTSEMLNNSESEKPFGKDDNPDIICYNRNENEIIDLSDRITVIENTIYKYYAKVKLPYNMATSRTRIMLPFDTINGIYKVSNNCSPAVGAAMPISISDNTISGTIGANSSVYIKMATGDPSSSAGKQIIFAVYPGSSNSGENIIVIERTNISDDVTNIDIDFS